VHERLSFGTDNRSKIASRDIPPPLRDISADLQLLAMNVYVRRWYDNPLCRASFGIRFNHPLPAQMAIFIERPSCTTAFPDLHSPVIAVGRYCEHKRDRCRNHYSAQRSNQKYASHFSNKLTSVGLLSLVRVRQILRATQELYLAPSFARVLFPLLPCTKDRSSASGRFLVLGLLLGRSFDVQAIRSQLWLNSR
jgi:hypothetical protein